MRKRIIEMVVKEDSYDRPNLLGQLYIQSLVPESLSLEVDAPEFVNDPTVVRVIMEDNLSVDDWQCPYIDYLIHQTLLKDLKLQSKLMYKAW